MSNFDKVKGVIYSEKSSKLLSENKYTFKICSTATKDEISSIISQLYNVDVVKVNIINTPIKIKRFKGVEGKINTFKKAIVKIKEGNTINIGQ